ERGQSVQKDEEILLLKTQLADAQAEVESSRSYAQKLAEEKMALLVKVEQERADSADYKASCHWAVKPKGILNPFAIEKEIPLKESLEAHAIRLAKKKGVKGKAILCGVGAAHIPRSDGVPALAW
ncbi:hypothetical protein Tco_0159817, partial [Tanacetum coccineum]